MAELAGTALVGAMVWGKSGLQFGTGLCKVGIYGAGLVGKTTPDRFMTTPGEMEEIDEEDRTTHLKLLGKFLYLNQQEKSSMERRKRVVSFDMRTRRL